MSRVEKLRAKRDRLLAKREELLRDLVRNETQLHKTDASLSRSLSALARGTRPPPRSKVPEVAAIEELADTERELVEQGQLSPALAKDAAPGVVKMRRAAREHGGRTDAQNDALRRAQEKAAARGVKPWKPKREVKAKR